MNDDSLSQQGDAHVRLEPVRPGAAGFLVRFSLGFLGFCFASFWFCFVLFSSSRSSCCLTFWEMSMRAVILMSGAYICQIWRWWQISTMPLSGADFPSVFFKLCRGTQIWKSVEKKRAINYLLSGADWRNRPGWQWLHKFQRVCLAHDQVCICLCLYFLMTMFVIV